MVFATRVLAVALVTAGFAPATSTARATAVPQQSPTCPKTYTIGMFRRAAYRAYWGTETPTALDRSHLRRFMRCQRYPWGAKFVPGVLKRARDANLARKQAAAQAKLISSMSVAGASWYNDAGSTASGFHSTYGFATCGSGGGPCLSFGTRVLFCYPSGSSHCAVGVADDHGPYVAGRGFDLNQNLAAALGFGGVGDVSWRIL